MDRPKPSWKAQAACRGMDPVLFFPESGLMTPEAAEACARCEVRRQCLEFGMHEEHGIWGGLTWRQRSKRKKKERRRAA